MFSKNLTDNMVFLGIEKIYSESTTKDLSDNIKVREPVKVKHKVDGPIVNGP